MSATYALGHWRRLDLQASLGQGAEKQGRPLISIQAGGAGEGTEKNVNYSLQERELLVSFQARILLKPR